MGENDPFDVSDIVERFTAIDGEVMVVAHRGARQSRWPRRDDAPENSIAAVENAIAMGADMVEVDVRTTADGRWVVMHDETVDRTTQGRGRIADLRWEELARLRLRAADGRIVEESPPCLEDLLARTRGRIMVNLDIKAAQAWRVAEAVGRLGMAQEVVFKEDVTRPGALGISRDFRIMPLLHGTPRLPIDIASLGRTLALYAARPLAAPALELVELELAAFAAVRQAARVAGMRIWNNTLSAVGVLGVIGLGGDAEATSDGGQTWAKQIAQGVSIIQTDAPAALLAHLGRLTTTDEAAP